MNNKLYLIIISRIFDDENFKDDYDVVIPRLRFGHGMVTETRQNERNTIKFINTYYLFQ